MQPSKFGADPDEARSTFYNLPYGVAFELIAGVLGRIQIGNLVGRLQIDHHQAIVGTAGPQPVFLVDEQRQIGAKIKVSESGLAKSKVMKALLVDRKVMQSGLAGHPQGVRFTIGGNEADGVDASLTKTVFPTFDF